MRGNTRERGCRVVGELIDRFCRLLGNHERVAFAQRVNIKKRQHVGVFIDSKAWISPAMIFARWFPP
jgi:hypothetical protein